MVVVSSSSLLILIWWLLLTIISPPPPVSCNTPVSCNDNERKALLTFKASLTDQSNRLSSWSPTHDSNCCNWEGVSCSNQTGHVSKLKLRNPFDDIYDSEQEYQNFMLQGEISSSLLELKSLEYLDLSLNDFSGGTIPSFMGSLEKLRYLDLSFSRLSGLVPPHLGNLSSLHYLDLGNNDGLEIESLRWLPSLSSLEHLNLNHVNLSKAGPNWFNSMPPLSELHLSNCDLPSLPSSSDDHFVNLTALSTLDLSNNIVFTSPLMPPWLFNISGLVNLNLHQCFLQVSAVSHEIKSLVQLQHLDLSGNNIGGPLPATALGSLVKLVYLDLSRNSLSGSIPSAIGRLTSLKILNLSDNQMNGTIAEAIGQLLHLEKLALSNNPWQGLLTEAHFRKHSNLQVLWLSTSSEGNLSMDVEHDLLPPFTRLRIVILNRVKMRSKKFPAWLQTQRGLEFLSLMDCGISDSIPDEFWQSCTNITRLYLSNNAISTVTSQALEGLVLPKLTYFYLDNNSFGFAGQIPSNIGQLAPALVVLDLSSNSISGEIPPSVCDLRNLTVLSLQNNFLTGELTQQHWDQMEFLDILDLSNNSLVGKIPKSIGSLSYLSMLLLNDNNLDGEIPSFRNCTSLRILDMGGNKLTGYVPPRLAESKPDLVFLRLRGNMLGGTIPSELCLLSGLKTLDLSHNRFRGMIPRCLGNLSTLDEVSGQYPEDGIPLVSKGREYNYDSVILSLVHLVDLSDNHLSGEIPEGLMNLTAIQTLNLSMNHLTGEIPSNIGELRMLESLDLSQNQLCGLIPQSLSSLSSLSYLNLSHNNLSGIIPFSRQLQTLEEFSSFDGNPLLCGPPLPTNCLADDTTRDHQGVGEEKLEHGMIRIDLDEWGFILSLVLGFFVGFWGVCGPLVTKASWRQAYFGYLEGVKDKIIVAVLVIVARLWRKITDFNMTS